MATNRRLRIIDETSDSSQELEVYVNDRCRIYLQVGQLDECYYSGYITLSKEDALELAQELNNLANEM